MAGISSPMAEWSEATGTNTVSTVKENDPGEMVNQATDPDFKNVLNRHREFLKEHAERHKDTVVLEMLRNLE